MSFDRRLKENKLYSRNEPLLAKNLPINNSIVYETKYESFKFNCKGSTQSYRPNETTLTLNGF